MKNIGSQAVTAGTKQRRMRNWLGWMLAAAILATLLPFLDPGELLRAFERLSAFEILLLLALTTLDRILMGVKWGVLLRIAGVELSWARIVAAYYQGTFVGILMPSHIGGDLLRAWLVARDSGIRYPVFASLVMERLLGFVSAVNWALLGSVFLSIRFDPQRWPLWAGLGLLAALSGNGLFLLSLHRRTHAFILARLGRRHRSRGIGILHGFYESYARFSRDSGRLALDFALTLFEHLLQMAIVFVIARSLDIAAPAAVFFAATAVYLLILRIPVAPDGWGVGEATAIGVFALIGITAENAFAVSLTGHALMLAGALPGLLVFLLHRQQPGELLARIEATGKTPRPGPRVELRTGSCNGCGSCPPCGVSPCSAERMEASSSPAECTCGIDHAHGSNC